MGNGRSFRKGPGMRPTEDKLGLSTGKRRKRASRRDVPKLQAQFKQIIDAAKKAGESNAVLDTTVLDSAKNIQAVPATEKEED